VLVYSDYRVTLDDGDLRWRTWTSTGEELVYEEEPETTWWQRFVTGVIGILPIQSQL